MDLFEQKFTLTGRCPESNLRDSNDSRWVRTGKRRADGPRLPEPDRFAEGRAERSEDDRRSTRTANPRGAIPKAGVSEAGTAAPRPRIRDGTEARLRGGHLPRLR